MGNGPSPLADPRGHITGGTWLLKFQACFKPNEGQSLFVPTTGAEWHEHPRQEVKPPVQIQGSAVGFRLCCLTHYSPVSP